MNRIVVYKLGIPEDVSYFFLPEKDHRKKLKEASKGKIINWDKLDFFKQRENFDTTFSSFGLTNFYGICDEKVRAKIKSISNIYFAEVNVSNAQNKYTILLGIDKLNVLDMNKSIYESLDENRIIYIDKYVFKSDSLKECFLFLIPGFNGTFATQKFKDLYEKEDWSGFTFEKVWEIK